MKTLRTKNVRAIGGPLDGELVTIRPRAWRAGFFIHEFAGPDGEDWMCGYFLTGRGSDGIDVYVAAGRDGMPDA